RRSTPPPTSPTGAPSPTCRRCSTTPTPPPSRASSAGCPPTPTSVPEERVHGNHDLPPGPPGHPPRRDAQGRRRLPHGRGYRALVAVVQYHQGASNGVR